MSNIIGEASWSITVAGLVAGTALECSVQWTPSDASTGFNTGFSSQKVRTNGTIKFFEDIDVLRNGSDRAGTLKAWIRDAGSGFDGAPLQLDDGPAVIELHIP